MAALQKYSAPINSSSDFRSLMAFGKPAVQYRNASLASSIPQRYLGLANANLQKIRKEKRAQYVELLQTHVTKNHVFLSYDDGELCSLAKVLSKQYALFMATITDWNQAYKDYSLRLVRSGFQSLDSPKNGQTHESVCRRLASQKFWRKLLRTTQARTLEAEHVRLGHVSRVTKQLYVSNEALNSFEKTRQRNKDLLQSIEAINDDGYSASLDELSSVSVSNPELRRNELMARLRGLESYADSMGLVGEFYTLTCPSKYHRYSGRRFSLRSLHSYFLNSKYDSYTPRDAQSYLNKQWAKIRAELNRQNLPLMGMRVAEPHHDGTPHWHMLFFINRKHRSQIRQVFRKYALEVNPDEKGAQKHRFTAIKIRKHSKQGKKQTAVGYIAKYISKNLSFSSEKTKFKTPLEGSFVNDGAKVSDSINRVAAWASLWGIRQFQQIGGERITVWRELRRFNNDQDAIPSTFLSIYKAADAGNYSDFIKASIKTKKVKIERKFEQIESINTHKDRLYFNIFDEFRQAPIIGLSVGNIFLQTRIHQWITKKRKLSIYHSLLSEDGTAPAGAGLGFA